MSAARDFLLSEKARLEASLKADPRSIELARVNAALDAYEKSTPNGAADDHGDAAGTKIARAKHAVLNYLRQHGPTPRGVLLKHLTEVGVMGFEQDPMQNLSFY